MSYISPTDRSQFVMMNTLDELVCIDHPVRLIDVLIHGIVRDNPREFGRATRGDVGRPEYSPETLLKLYVYGTIHGIRSSRRLERETKRNIEIMWLLGMLSPDHWTISNYRKEQGEQITFVVQKLQGFLRDHGYITGKRVAVDGSKFKANAEREMVSLSTIEQRLAKLTEYLAQLEANDVFEGVEEELERVTSTTSTLARERQLAEEVTRLRQEVEHLKHQRRNFEDTKCKIMSPTDPDAKLMRSRDGKIPAYNVQIVVDEAHKLIAASEVITEQNDREALPLMMDVLKENLGIVPEEILADAGYYNPELIEQVEHTHGSTCYIPVPHNKKHDPSVLRFTYDEQDDRYICSQGKPLILFTKNKARRRGIADGYRGTECAKCPIRTECTTSLRGRTVYRYHNQHWREGFIKRMGMSEAKARCACRRSLVEHPFGTIKCLAGKIPLLLRGKLKVAIEVKLFTLGYNLKRLMNITPIRELIQLVNMNRWVPA